MKYISLQIVFLVITILIILFCKNWNIEKFSAKKVDTLGKCNTSEDCTKRIDECTVFDGTPKRCLNLKQMREICSLKNTELTIKSTGEKVCEKGKFPKYNPDYVYGTEKDNYKHFCEKGKALNLCTENPEFAKSCVDTCGYPKYNDVVEYPKNQETNDNHDNYCEYGKERGYCNYPEFATACVRECGYPEYNDNLTYPSKNEGTPYSSNNYINYCQSGKLQNECRKTSTFADACIDECGYPGFNDKVTYPIMSSENNYENYCESGKDKGLCTMNDKFSTGCREQC